MWNQPCEIPVQVLCTFFCLSLFFFSLLTHILNISLLLDMHYNVLFFLEFILPCPWFSFVSITQDWIIESTHKTLQGLLIEGFNKGKGYAWEGERKHRLALLSQETSRCSPSGAFLSHAGYSWSSDQKANICMRKFVECQVLYWEL